jgi:hypothetical protein
MSKQKRVTEALRVLAALGLPQAQQNERSALCLLALLGLSPDKSWPLAGNPLMGITPIMDWVRQHYKKDYAWGSRESFRKHTMHQFVDAAIAVYNPNQDRAVNSPKAAYQVESEALALMRTFGTKAWKAKLAAYSDQHETLVAKYAKRREQTRIPVRIAEGKEITLSPGEHSQLIRAIIEDFRAYFLPDGQLIYAGDTGDKLGHFDVQGLADLGVEIDRHGKMPDVVLYDARRMWLLLVEAVTSSGPVDGKRHAELHRLFGPSKAGIVYVTAFPNRALMQRYLSEIAWETEVWIADAPSHLIHFNGEKFLGPHNS